MLYNNWYSTISNFPNICYLIKLFINKLAFKKYLKQDNTKNKFSDLFSNSITSVAKEILLADYINSLQGNWEIIYTGTRDKNKENNANTVNNNINTIEREGRNIENSNNINF